MTERQGPWWVNYAILDLFVLVLLVSYLVYRHIKRRNAKVKEAKRAYEAARDRLLRTYGSYQFHRPVPLLEVMPMLIVYGHQSTQAFQRLQRLAPEAQVDRELLVVLRWVEKKSRQLGFGPRDDAPRAQA